MILRIMLRRGLNDDSKAAVRLLRCAFLANEARKLYYRFVFHVFLNRRFFTRHFTE